MFLCGFAAGATPVIVEQVQGNKATVYVAPNIVLKPGDSLYLEAPSNPAPSQDKPGSTTQSINQEPTSPPKLRDRVQHIMGTVSTINVSLSLDAPINSDLSETETSATIEYGYSFGFLEPFVGVSTSTTKTNLNSSAKPTFTEIGLRANLIRDIPGNDLIPYGKVGIGYFDENLNTPSDVITILGPSYGAAIGLAWYPFGQIVALTGEYKYITGSLKATDINGSLSATYSASGFKIGTEIVF